MGTHPSRIKTLGQSLAVFGVLLLAIKVGLAAFDIADGGSTLLTFAAVFFILLGVALTFRSSSLGR